MITQVDIEDRDIHYLNSILRQLRQLKREQVQHSLGNEALADNIDWLDCFIERVELT